MILTALNILLNCMAVGEGKNFKNIKGIMWAHIDTQTAHEN
jgi:hypothetical protein